MTVRRLRVDVIVAVRDEAAALPHFLGQIDALVLPADVDLRVLFVEDSSTDGTRALLRKLARPDSRIGYISLVKGFGQGLAVSFGLSRSRADAMIMMDGDGSHPVAAIPEMIAAFRAGAEVVQCVRRSLANREAHRRWATIAYQSVAGWLIGSDPAEQNIFYRLVSAEFARRLLTQPRHLSYLRFPLPRRPGALKTIPVDTPERQHGASKYPPLRLAQLASDAILSQIPTGRLVAFAALAGLAAVLALGAGIPALAGAIGGGLALALLRSGGGWSRMQILESANLDAGSSMWDPVAKTCGDGS